MRVLRLARRMDLPQWRLVSGCIYQTVWNAVTDRHPDHGIKDYDLFYFEASDLSYQAEDMHIKRMCAVSPDDLRPKIEIRNQARVHLWFEKRFGEPYAPCGSTEDPLLRFVATAYAVAVRLTDSDGLDIVAPFGLEPLFSMRLTPNPLRPLSNRWASVTAALRVRWPELTVENPAFSRGVTLGRIGCGGAGAPPQDEISAQPRRRRAWPC
jgi:hypothetical protein